MKNVQNDSSEFDELLHEMVFKEPFTNQYIVYINSKGEMILWTVSDYIKEFLSIIEIEKENVSHMQKM